MTTVWLVGRFDRPESALLEADVLNVLRGASLFRFETPGDAAGSSVPPADLVLTVQLRPSEFPRRDIDRLIGSQPLARFVVGLGPWCASFGRSERTWPEAATVPLWEVRSRLAREAAVLTGRPPLPITAGRDEAVLFDLEVSRQFSRSRDVLIDSPDRQFLELLSDLVTLAGGTPVAMPGSTEVDVVLWDADPCSAARLGRLAALRAGNASCRVVALTALPTRSDAALLRRQGADAVVAKPFSLGDLMEGIEP